MLATLPVLVTRATRAAERLRALPTFAGLSLGEVLARKDSVRRKHALAVIAREQGHGSWAELKQALGEEEQQPYGEAGYNTPPEPR